MSVLKRMVDAITCNAGNADLIFAGCAWQIGSLIIGSIMNVVDISQFSQRMIVHRAKHEKLSIDTSFILKDGTIIGEV
jgi:hypothetical protein